MAAFALKVDLAAVRAFFTGLDIRVRAARTHALQEVGAFLEGAMKRAAPVKTGRLRSSIAFQQTGEDRIEVGVVNAGDELVYAAIQEFGGTVSGRPLLAIPIPYAGNPVLTKSGVGAIRARDVRAAPGQFGFTSTFRGGGPRTQHLRSDIVYGAGPAGLRALFVLKESVTLHGKGYIYGTYDANEEKVVEWIRNAVTEAAANG